MPISTAFAGLPTTEFVAALALVVGVYLLVHALFVSTAAPAKGEGKEKEKEKEKVPVVGSEGSAVPTPVEIGDMTSDELRKYDGSDPKTPLLMAIRGKVYDVSKSRMHYGPGSPYSLFAGREASRALALMSFDQSDLTDDIEGLSKADLEVLQDWECKFVEKYIKVGQIVPKECSIVN